MYSSAKAADTSVVKSSDIKKDHEVVSQEVYIAIFTRENIALISLFSRGLC